MSDERYNDRVISGRTWAALAVAKQAAFWSRRLHRGGGEALPGLIAERLSPRILTELTETLPQGTVIVTGTNGKTTTSLAMDLVLSAQGLRVLRNRGGSNLTRGLVSALVQSSSLVNPRPREDIALFEVDEATMPQATAQVSPRLILVTNVFQDQLDRFGDINTTASLIRRGIEQAPEAALVLNADDPVVAALGRDRARVIYYGLDDTSLHARTEPSIDTIGCPLCHSPLHFERRYFSHLGHFRCDRCGFTRPRPRITARNVRLGSAEISASVMAGDRILPLVSGLSGLYNLYNLLAAVAATEVLDVNPKSALDTLTTMEPPFGRLERFVLHGRTGIMHLVKNPTGFNQVIDNVSAWDAGPAALLCLNDNPADGTDVSWIWDVDFAPLAVSFHILIVSGTRAAELALRLKYAGMPMERVIVEPDLLTALDSAVRLVEESAVLNILTTYTAMLELRAGLVRRGVLQEYWR
ncbi:MAG: DUF1727 domain-containing protein [Actinobacteria bacterium]|nr:DUF1727 domain-containing protein [Actinomycetota bacterium]